MTDSFKIRTLKVSEGESSPDFHKPPRKGPPRHDLRKPKVLDDPDLDKDVTEEDEDLKLSS